MVRGHEVILFFWPILCLIPSLECLLPKASAGNPPTLRSIPVVEYLVQSLENERWSDDEACREATLRLLNGVKNDTLWATAMWDSMQPPFGVFFGSGINLGSYDQCLRSFWSSEIMTQYCLVEVKIRTPQAMREFGPYDSADEYLNAGRASNQFSIGVCMPAVCSLSSIAHFYQHVLRTTHLPEAEVVTLDPENCQGVKPEPYPKKFYVFWSVIGLLLVVVVASTIYTHMNETKASSNIDVIAASFSVIQNWKALLKVSTAEIRIFSGMRSISMFIVVFTHHVTLFLHEPSIIINNLDLETITDGLVGQAVGHIDLVVDTFFVLSGLLLAKNLLSGTQNNLFLVLLKRYLRLMSLYAVMTLYILCVAQYTAAGPLWLKANSNEGSVCEVHWWKNILMISTELKTMCFGVAWYVTCDYHLVILTAVLYWIYRKNQKTGVMAFIAVGCGLTLKLVVKAFILRTPLIIYDIHALSDIRNYKVLDDVYVKWQDRAGSYLVGIAMGWLMTKYKPAVYRSAISKQTSVLITAVSLCIMFMVTTIGYWLSEAGRMEVAVAIATNRVVWAVAICGLIGACEYGSVPVISEFLGSSVFAPLGKLSYGIYLTHFFVVQRNIHVSRSPLYFDLFTATINVLGTTAMSCAVSLVLYMLVEAPCINLSNYYLSERKKEDLNMKAVNEAVLGNGTVHVNGTVLRNGTNGTTKFKAS